MLGYCELIERFKAVVPDWTSWVQFFQAKFFIIAQATLSAYNVDRRTSNIVSFSEYILYVKNVVVNFNKEINKFALL